MKLGQIITSGIVASAVLSWTAFADTRTDFVNIENYVKNHYNSSAIIKNQRVSGFDDEEIEETVLPPYKRLTFTQRDIQADVSERGLLLMKTKNGNRILGCGNVYEGIKRMVYSPEGSHFNVEGLKEICLGENARYGNISVGDFNPQSPFYCGEHCGEVRNLGNKLINEIKKEFGLK